MKNVTKTEMVMIDKKSLKNTMTKTIYLNERKLRNLSLDCQPNTDFVEFYVNGVYITKVNVNRLSKAALLELEIETKPLK